MGASVRAYWKKMSKEQRDSQPGFENDCKAWGNWMAERTRHPDVMATIKELNLCALLACKTAGMWWFQIKWATPRGLANAARCLREMVAERNPRVERILDSYAEYEGVDDVEGEFSQDLSDIEQIATFAESLGVEKMTLEVNW